MKQLPNGPQNLLNFQRLLQSIRLIANKSSSPQVVGAIDGSHIALNTVPVNEQIEYSETCIKRTPSGNALVSA